MTGPHSSSLCLCCGTAALREIAGFTELPRVTSDSKPFGAGGRLFVCSACGLTQKLPDPAWLAEIAGIYDAYNMHHQAGGTPDQVIFDPQTGAPTPRCELLARRLSEAGLPDAGAMLDVGVGGGAMVSAFSRAFPRWRLFGLDLDERKLDVLRRIPRFERLFTCPADQLDLSVDLMTLVHSLEHLLEPRVMLRTLRDRLGQGGRLFIQVSNTAQNPFDLVIADNLCHFSQATLESMVSRAGFVVEHSRTDWVPKELSFVAQRGADREPAPCDGAAAVAAVSADVDGLHRLLAGARRLGASAPFGILGTSVAATWLAGALGDRVAFFVDEDPARVGREHLGRPVFRPSDAPAGAVIYLAFPAAIAQSIARRLAPLGLRLELPEFQSPSTAP